MGHTITCGSCGAQVYTTGDRMPKHLIPPGPNHVGEKWCDVNRKSLESESVVGFDSDPWVYGGGLPELGKDR